MNIPVHRQTDSRVCGATTIVVGQSNVYVNGLLASVEGDVNTHANGNLTASNNDGSVFINGKKVVLKGSAATPDRLLPPLGPPHGNPLAVGASPNVFACGGAGSGGSGRPDPTNDPQPASYTTKPSGGAGAQSASSLADEEASRRSYDAQSDPSAGGSITPAPGTMTEREKEAYDYFISQGYTPEQAAGIVGNLVRESSVNPNAINPNDAGTGYDSEGLAQWNKDRLANLKSFAAEKGTNYKDFNTQLAFIDHELRGPPGNGGSSESAAYNRLQSSTTATDAALAMSKYERYQGHELNLQSHETQQRAAEAERILNNGTI